MTAKRDIPYHRYTFGDEEFEAVAEVMRSGWLTTGPRVAAFEAAFSRYKETGHAVAVNSCTAGLSILLDTLDLQYGDEVITTTFTFASTANVIVHKGCVPVFVDIDPDTLNMDPATLEANITPRTKAIIAVHVAGNMCDMDGIRTVADAYGIPVIEDCAHAIESTYKGRPSGFLGYGGAFSFYANKNLTTGEGGMVTANDPAIVEQMKILRNHGVDKDTYVRDGFKYFLQYDIVEAGHKFNMSEIQAVLGHCQLNRLAAWQERRKAIYQRYAEAFDALPCVSYIQPPLDTDPAHHLFILRLEPKALNASREAIMNRITDRGVQLSISFKPVHLFSYYRNAFRYEPGTFPRAEDSYARIFSLPIFPALSNEEVDYVIDIVTAVLREAKR